MRSTLIVIAVNSFGYGLDRSSIDGNGLSRDFLANAPGDRPRLSKYRAIVQPSRSGFRGLVTVFSIESFDDRPFA
ncbi:hypothetical protein V0288_11325 [Pannus brasiliensis CCIBt3594]|uniref:Uncharacterized protein n=1 Tax=Pannus brasiliensis CCIBt3594 TaxID=1427578 RepID=A0AAW9QR62_9CHRO